jgi:uncharacterized C2H2 Zn-finger protein
MDTTPNILNDLAFSLEAAGRNEDAQLVLKAKALYKEVGEWIACLRCGMAFPTNEAHKAHYTKVHGVRSFWGGR